MYFYVLTRELGKNTAVVKTKQYIIMRFNLMM